MEYHLQTPIQALGNGSTPSPRDPNELTRLFPPRSTPLRRLMSAKANDTLNTGAKDLPTQLVISFTLGLGAFFTFCFLRPRWSTLYAARKKQVHSGMCPTVGRWI